MAIRLGLAPLVRYSRIFLNASSSNIHKSLQRCYCDDIPNKLGVATTFAEKKLDLAAIYKNARLATEAFSLPGDLDPTTIFANNELDLIDIDVYGFDYDYTIASYKPTLHYLIYNLGRDALVRDQKYPNEISSFNYDPTFAIRGLHCDIGKGLLLKIDAFHNIQMGTVYRGLQQVPSKEVQELYNGTHVAIDNMSSFHGTGPSMHQLMDLFALPEMTLFSHVIEYFVQNNIQYDPEVVFNDVRTTVQGLHSSGILHNEIMQNTGVFIDRSPAVTDLFRRLKAANKNVFLVTNSGINFVDAGMRFLVGDDWRDLFDVIIVNARKPKFFYDSTRPFRGFDTTQGIKSWDRISELKHGHVYMEGSLQEFQQLTGWQGSRVLYFGDHVYSDLADPALKHGWRTGAIIPELEGEIKVMNSLKYKQSVRWLMVLEHLIQKIQMNLDDEAEIVRNGWLRERDDLRKITKTVFNQQFGSVFRTYHNPTYFTRRLNRFADIYMTNMTNLLNYSLDYTFYPRRSALPHELIFRFPNLLDDLTS